MVEHWAANELGVLPSGDLKWAWGWLWGQPSAGHNCHSKWMLLSLFVSGNGQNVISIASQCCVSCSVDTMPKINYCRFYFSFTPQTQICIYTFQRNNSGWSQVYSTLLYSLLYTRSSERHRDRDEFITKCHWQPLRLEGESLLHNSEERANLLCLYNQQPSFILEINLKFPPQVCFSQHHIFIIISSPWGLFQNNNSLPCSFTGEMYLAQRHSQCKNPSNL